MTREQDERLVQAFEKIAKALAPAAAPAQTLDPRQRSIVVRSRFTTPQRQRLVAQDPSTGVSK